MNGPSALSPKLHFYFDVDITIDFIFDDTNTSIDLSQHAIRFLVFSPAGKSFAKEPVITGKTYTFTFTNEETVQIAAGAFFYELEAKISDKRFVWLANRFIVARKPSHSSSCDINITLGDDPLIQDLQLS